MMYHFFCFYQQHQKTSALKKRNIHMILRKSHFNLVCIVSIRKGLHKTQDQTQRISSHTSTQNISARKFAARQIIGSIYEVLYVV